MQGCEPPRLGCTRDWRGRRERKVDDGHTGGKPTTGNERSRGQRERRERNLDDRQSAGKPPGGNDHSRWEGRRKLSEHEFDHRRWYDEVASRTGGYLETWRSTVEGRSGEDAFRELVFGLLEPGMHVLDAGCGSGEFTLAIAQQVERVVGFDFSENMVAAARENARSLPALPVEFVVTETSRLPFEPGSFDLIVSRRGPTGILLRPELLRPGGVMAGIHSLRPDRIRERLAASGLDELGFEHYLANEIFPTRGDFAAFWSRMPGHADYSRPEHEAALEELARKHLTGGRLVVPQERWVWWALLPGVES